jgi:hypothetical protein
VVPALTTVGSSNVVLFANAAKLYKVQIAPSMGSLVPSSWAPGAAIYGRVSIPFGVAYFIDYTGTLFAADPSTLGNSWSYQDATTHGSCSSGSNCGAKNLFVDYGMGAANGNAFFGDRDGHVYSINTTSHLALTGYPYRPGTSSDIFETAPLYRAGILAVGTTAGKVYFIDHRTALVGTPGLQSSYDFCTTATCTNSAISSIAFDFDGTVSGKIGQYVIGTADGKIYFVSSITDPTNTYN